MQIEYEVLIKYFKGKYLATVESIGVGAQGDSIAEVLFCIKTKLEIQSDSKCCHETHLVSQENGYVTNITIYIPDIPGKSGIKK